MPSSISVLSLNQVGGAYKHERLESQPIDKQIVRGLGHCLTSGRKLNIYYFNL